MRHGEEKETDQVQEKEEALALSPAHRTGWWGEAGRPGCRIPLARATSDTQCADGGLDLGWGDMGVEVEEPVEPAGQPADSP